MPRGPATGAAVAKGPRNGAAGDRRGRAGRAALFNELLRQKVKLAEQVQNHPLTTVAELTDFVNLVHNDRNDFGKHCFQHLVDDRANFGIRNRHIT